MWAKLKAYWVNHAQKTIASFLVALAVMDLTPYADAAQEVLGGKHWNAGLRLVGGLAIIWRAMQASR